MPLKKSKSKAAFKSNVKELVLWLNGTKYKQ